MKTLLLIISTLAIGLMSVGCSKSNSQSKATVPAGSSPVAGAPVDPNPGGSSSSNSISFSTGATVDFVPDSFEAFEEFNPQTVLNNPTQIKLNINLAQSAAARYGGSVTIAFFNNGRPEQIISKAGMGTNTTLSGLYDNGVLEANYNYWFKLEKQLIFTGFFEGNYGAITLSLLPENPNVTATGDAEPLTNTKYKGAIYFKKFKDKNSDATFGQHSEYRSCWFTYVGPYDCRSNVIQTKCGIYPGAEAGYKLIGTFSGLDAKAAFNIK